jgi:hypothetical protein
MEETAMSNTHDDQIAGCITEFVPPENNDPNAWYNQPAWQDYRKAQAIAEGRTYVAPAPIPAPVVEDACTKSQRQRREWAAQDAAREARINPPPYTPDPALVAAEANLRAAVVAMMRWAKTEAIVSIVRSCVPDSPVMNCTIVRPGQR